MLSKCLVRFNLFNKSLNVWWSCCESVACAGRAGIAVTELVVNAGGSLVVDGWLAALVTPVLTPDSALSVGADVDDDVLNHCDLIEETMIECAGGMGVVACGMVVGLVVVSAAPAVVRLLISLLTNLLCGLLRDGINVEPSQMINGAGVVVVVGVVLLAKVVVLDVVRLVVLLVVVAGVLVVEGGSSGSVKVDIGTYSANLCSDICSIADLSH